MRLSEASELSPRLHASASAPNLNKAASLNLSIATTDTNASSSTGTSDSAYLHGSTRSSKLPTSRSTPAFPGTEPKRPEPQPTVGDARIKPSGTRQPQQVAGKGGIEVHSILHGSGIMLPTRYHHWEQIFVYPIRKVKGAAINAATLLMPKQYAKNRTLRKADGSIPEQTPTMIHVNLGQRVVQYWTREELCCEKPLAGAQVQRDTSDVLKFRVYYPNDPEPLEHWMRDAASRQDMLDLLTIACAPDFRRYEI